MHLMNPVGRAEMWATRANVLLILVVFCFLPPKGWAWVFPFMIGAAWSFLETWSRCRPIIVKLLDELRADEVSRG